jgi:hypothetical protein
MISASERGDRKLEAFWSDAMDRFLDTFARENCGDDQRIQ